MPGKSGTERSWSMMRGKVKHTMRDKAEGREDTAVRI
jgi:hypothetical protein